MSQMKQALEIIRQAGSAFTAIMSTKPNPLRSQRVQEMVDAYYAPLVQAQQWLGSLDSPKIEELKSKVDMLVLHYQKAMSDENVIEPDINQTTDESSSLESALDKLESSHLKSSRVFHAINEIFKLLDTWKEKPETLTSDYTKYFDDPEKVSKKKGPYQELTDAGFSTITPSQEVITEDNTDYHTSEDVKTVFRHDRLNNVKTHLNKIVSSGKDYYHTLIEAFTSLQNIFTQSGQTGKNVLVESSKPELMAQIKVELDKSKQGMDMELQGLGRIYSLKDQAGLGSLASYFVDILALLENIRSLQEANGLYWSLYNRVQEYVEQEAPANKEKTKYNSALRELKKQKRQSKPKSMVEDLTGFNLKDEKWDQNRRYLDETRRQKKRGPYNKPRN